MGEQPKAPPEFVRDLMTVGVVTCAPATPVVEVARAILAKDVEAVVVQDTNKHALGVVTQDELVEAYTRGEWDDLKAEDIMQVELPQLPPDIPLTAAAQIMRDRGWRVAYTTHHAAGVEYPAAVLSYKHLLRQIAAEEQDDLKDLGIGAEREGPIDIFIKRRDEARRRNLPKEQNK